MEWRIGLVLEVCFFWFKESGGELTTTTTDAFGDS